MSRYHFLRKHTIKSWETLHTYKRGLIVGAGAVTSVGGLTYWFWPTIQNMVTNTTKTVLSHEDIQTTASSLTNNILEDEHTYEKACDLVIRVLNTKSVQDATTDVVIGIIRKPQVQEELKQLLIRTYNDPEIMKHSANFAGMVVQSEVVQEKVHQTVEDVLANEILRKKTSEALKASMYGMFKW